MVIQRHLISCLKKAQTGRNSVLTWAARVKVEDGEEVSSIEHLPHLHQVSDRVETRLELRALTKAIMAPNVLTDMERHCVIGIASGLAYCDIHPDTKMVDNALLRARKKLRNKLRAA